jgi:hypothetical protein
MDWLRENLNRKPLIFHDFLWGFPVNFPLNQSIEKPQSQDAYLLLEFG